MDPPALLDPIITSLSNYYQVPEYVEPLVPDIDKNGKKSDHKIVLARPINEINNKSARRIKIVKFRPFPQSGMNKMKDWFIDQTWSQVYEATSAHEKAKIFQELLLNALDDFFPEKKEKLAAMISHG